MIAGSACLEVRHTPRGVRRSTVRRSQCTFLPQQTVHRLVNRSRRPARYLYLTG